MRKIFFLFFIIIANCFSISAQEDPTKVHALVEQKAGPKEGMQAFFQNFITAFNAPNVPKEIKELSIRLKFVVETDGTFSNIEELKEDTEAGREAIRVLKSMPTWNPAKHKGKNVRSAFTLPIKIKINDTNKDSEQPIYTTNEQVEDFKKSLKTNLIDAEYFNLECNCALVRSSTNNELLAEEFVLHTNDQTGIYNVVFRKIDEKQAEEELRTIETDAEKQNAIVKTIVFNGVKATEITFSMPDGDYVNQYRTLFLYKNNYLIGVSLVSYNKQLADLLFEHLKENFKLKI